MEFRVLGPVGAAEGDDEVALGGPRPRRLLAALLVADGLVVSADRLVDAVWGDAADPPDGAAKTLHS